MIFDGFDFLIDVTQFLEMIFIDSHDLFAGLEGSRLIFIEESIDFSLYFGDIDTGELNVSCIARLGILHIEVDGQSAVSRRNFIIFRVLSSSLRSHLQFYVLSYLIDEDVL